MGRQAAALLYWGQCLDIPPIMTFSERYVILLFLYAAVAQLDRVLGYEPRGRGFESCQPRHYSGQLPLGSCPIWSDTYVIATQKIDHALLRPLSSKESKQSR